MKNTDTEPVVIPCYMCQSMTAAVKPFEMGQKMHHEPQTK